MFRQLIFCFLFLNIYTQISHGQNLQWATNVASAGWDQGNSICTDRDGNIYVTGFFRDTADFDPGPGIYSLIPLGTKDAFVTKLDKSGNHIWTVQFGAVGSELAQGTSISVDDSGNVLVTGSFAGYMMDFDPGPGVYNLSSPSNLVPDAFICKLSSGGSFMWAVDIGSNSWDGGYDITTDSLGNVYSTGSFSGTVDFDPGPGTFTYSTCTGCSHSFILKLTHSGSFVWAKQFGAGWPVYAYSLELDNSGNIYTAGIFSGACDFDTGPSTFILTTFGSQSSDGFITKLNNNGDFIWAKQIGGFSNDDRVSSMTSDPSGNVYITGGFTLTSDFDPGPGVSNMTALGSFDIFISKLDSSGNFVWAKQIGDSLKDIGISIAIDISGNIYTTGYFDGNIDFDPGPGTYNLVSDTLDIFIVKTDNSGNLTWADNMGGASIEIGNCIFVDNQNAIYTTGSFEGITDFSVDSGAVNLVSAGSYDVFIAKYRQCAHSDSTLFIEACNQYESPSGNNLWLSSGIYYDTIPNAAGCDSVITVDLTILPIPIVNILAIGSTTFCQGDSVILSATPGMLSYQWYRWNTAIAGAVSADYTAKGRGKYKCIAQNGVMCSDTSNAISVYVPCMPPHDNQERVVQNDELINTAIQIFPNPGSGIFTIELPAGLLQIFNSIGKLILSKEVNEEEVTIDISEYSDGIYLVILNTEGHSFSNKILLLR